ncbi:hypothetical protein HY490_05095 [Candidatus Woesearchaeota archaeon]|nr:hypothetical protein [Candidatus Woesearchaeota archaeon]
MLKRHVIPVSIFLIVAYLVSAFPARVAWTPQGFVALGTNSCMSIDGAVTAQNKETRCFRARAPCSPDYHVVIRGRGGAFCCPGPVLPEIEDISATYRAKQRVRSR